MAKKSSGGPSPTNPPKETEKDQAGKRGTEARPNIRSPFATTERPQASRAATVGDETGSQAPKRVTMTPTKRAALSRRLLGYAILVCS